MTILRRLRDDATYNLLGLPLALLNFVLLVALFAAGVGTVVVFVGIPLLALALLTARGFAEVERLRLNRLLGRELPRPLYQRAPAGSGWFRRLTTPLRQGQSWLDLLYGLLNLPVAIIAFAVTIGWWAMALGGLTYWFWGRFIPYGDDYRDVVIETVMGSNTAQDRVVYNTMIGVIAALTLYFVQRGAAALHAGYAQTLLTRLAQLQGRIEDLTASRAAVISAEAVALRRLERDIHDGPQQRLIRLAMELARAQRQVDSDPDAAKATIDSALGQAKETLDELRGLSRGIAPPVLTDRGLPAALTTLASRSSVPVDLSLSVDERLDPAMENTLYFCAAEALANVAKHSGATAVSVNLHRQDGRVYLIVTDNGTGGAHIAKGHGIAGLADRLHAMDGELAVDSPPGGPTVLVAEVPCG
jgi:signal transduction histidine kinase